MLNNYMVRAFTSAMLLALSVVLSGQAPSSVLPDIVNFKITYPLDENGDDYTGVAYGDRNNPRISGEEETELLDYVAPAPFQDYFYTSGNEVVFKAHCAGALTSINAYPRCELRELVGGTNSLWRFSDEHELNATFRVTHLPDLKKEVCILQIKGNSTNATSNTEEALRLEYREDGNQGLHLVINESSTIEDVMDYNLGETIEARLYINNGEINVVLNNTSSGGSYTHQYTSNYDWGYFKAGCYTQSSIWEEKNGVGDELPTAYGEVRFSRLVLGSLDFLPVNLLNFTGEYVEQTNEIKLDWQVGVEINNAGFSVERSSNLLDDFEQVGWVDGNGIEDEVNDYYFVDKQIVNNIKYYYRLRQVDFDGEETLSDVIQITPEKIKEEWLVFPNPVSDLLTIFYGESVTDLSCSIVNSNGKVVLSETREATNSESVSFDVEGLPPGLYTVIIDSPQTGKSVHKIIVN